MNFYKHFIGDYTRDTGDLTLAEHGAYRVMLDQFYGTSRPLPSEKRALYRLLRAETEPEKRAVDNVSLRFWRPVSLDVAALAESLSFHTEEERFPLMGVMTEWADDTGLINLRALREMVKARVIGDKNRKTAVEREQKRRAAKSEAGAE